MAKERVFKNNAFGKGLRRTPRKLHVKLIIRGIGYEKVFLVNYGLSTFRAFVTFINLPFMLLSIPRSDEKRQTT